MKKFLILCLIIGLVFSCKSTKVTSPSESSESFSAKEITEDSSFLTVEHSSLTRSENFEVSAAFMNKKSVLKKSSSKKVVKLTQNKKSNIGKLLYYIPDSMQVGKSYKIALRISNNTEYVNIISTKPDTVDLIAGKSKDIKVGKKMSIELSDGSDNKNFQIVKIGNEKQLIDSGKIYSEWIWNVTPIKSGNSQLMIIVSITLDDGTPDQIIDITKVFVKNNPTFVTKGFLEKYWQWLLSTLILPFIIWLINRKKKDK